jgi:hypothetical protein
MLVLQTLVGNRRIAGVFADSAGGEYAARRPVVQRCGDEVHAGCPCAGKEELAQRQAEQVVQRFTDGTPEAPSAELPPGSQYAAMDGELLSMLGRTLTGKTFWRWRNARPTNLGAALDLLGPADINTLVQLKRRMDLHGLWRFIDTISNLWSTSSLGVDYTGPGGVEGAVSGGNFCKDTAVGESYHPGQSCWREIVPPGTPGLHVCLPGSIHIDPHQTVDGKGWAWTWDADGIHSTQACTYEFLAFIGHMTDVVGGRPVNPFTHYGQIREQINSINTQLAHRVTRYPDLARNQTELNALAAQMDAIAPILRRWSVNGLDGGDGTAEAARLLVQLDEADHTLGRARSAVTGADESDVPSPTILYGP